LRDHCPGRRNFCEKKGQPDLKGPPRTVTVGSAFAKSPEKETRVA